MRDLTHHQNRQTLNQNTDFTVESIIYPVGPGAQLGASPSITRSATAQHRERPGYLLVVGELRFALSGQRVGPVLSHGPLLRWHGFHQGAIYPRLGAHAPRIPIMREIFLDSPQPKKVLSGGRERHALPLWIHGCSGYFCFCPRGATPLRARAVWSEAQCTRSASSQVWRCHVPLLLRHDETLPLELFKIRLHLAGDTAAFSRRK